MIKPSRKKWSRQMRPTRPRAAKAAARSFVGDELDGAEKSDRAHLADQRVVLEFREHLGDRWPRKLLDPWN